MRLFLLSPVVCFLIISCGSPGKEVQRTDYGRAQGSTYSISYIAHREVNHQPAIDSILEVIDLSMSTYRKESVISAVNRGEEVNLDPHFRKVLERSFEIWRDTEGYFDVSVYPLFSAWNFERKRQQILDSTVIDSLMAFVGMDKIPLANLDGFVLESGVKLDLNAIAQGYTVDVIAAYLESKGIENYLVEVGGELRTKGKNIDGQVWRIGIEQPTEEKVTDRFQKVIALKDAGLATSGSYRKYIEDTISGFRYSHAIDPHTGQATKDALMSVTVIAKTCMDADAYATALLVMGLEKARNFMRDRDDLAVYLIYHDKYRGWQEETNAAFDLLEK